MWGFGLEFQENRSLAPEWNDHATTPESVQENNPFGYALFNNYMAPVVSKPKIHIVDLCFKIMMEEFPGMSQSKTFFIKYKLIMVQEVRGTFIIFE